MCGLFCVSVFTPNGAACRNQFVSLNVDSMSSSSFKESSDTSASDDYSTFPIKWKFDKMEISSDLCMFIRDKMEI